MEKLFQKGKMAKTKMLAAQAGYSDLMRAIEKQEEWVWARTESLHKDVVEAKDKLETFKHSGPFWQDFVLQPDWMLHVKKNYKPEAVLVELRNIPKLENAIDSLDKEVRRLTCMHNASRRA